MDLKILISGICALALGLSSIEAVSQTLPPSALINQRAEGTVEAARAASPHTAETDIAHYQEDADDAVARAIERVWDRSLPLPDPPRMPWGDPRLEGYWLNSTYTPLERPEVLAGQQLYTYEDAILAF
jgi:hypothetical protein